MTHEEILAMLGDYVDYLIANSSDGPYGTDSALSE